MSAKPVALPPHLHACVNDFLTLANENLGPERLTGVEAGVSVAPTERLTVRGTLFNNRVQDPVANVTTNVAQTVRQRRNLGSTNIGGFQADASYRVSPRWGASAAYVFDQTSFPVSGSYSETCLSRSCASAN